MSKEEEEEEDDEWVRIEEQLDLLEINVKRIGELWRKEKVAK